MCVCANSAGSSARERLAAVQTRLQQCKGKAGCSAREKFEGTEAFGSCLIVTYSNSYKVRGHLCFSAVRRHLTGGYFRQ